MNGTASDPGEGSWPLPEDWLLVDVTSMPFHELMTSTDPRLVASVDRVVEMVLREDPADGCC